MAKDYTRWFEQADYDIETADVMFENGRYFYAVFMCHLALEKALKGIYQHKLDKIPPKTHNLIFLLNKIDVTPPEKIGRFFVTLNEASVATRYPEDLHELSKNYSQVITQHIMELSKVSLQWIRTLQ